MEKQITKDEFFMKATGGNNRKWATRYKIMLTKYDLLIELKADEEMLKGYRLCMDTFTKPLESKYNAR